MDFSFKTLTQFTDHFKDEKTCYAFLEEAWWGGVPVCPHCGNEKYYKVKPRGKFQDIPSYRCANAKCDLPFTIRTKSIFEGSQVELRKWFIAAYEIATSKKGISSVELAARIGTSQKTAWLISHKIRDMFSKTTENIDTPMGEGGQVVEIDETYVGGKLKNKSRKIRNAHRAGEYNQNTNKTAVMGYVVRGGNLKMQVVHDKKALAQDVLQKVSTEAVIITDASSMYTPISKRFAAHEIIEHNKDEFVRGTIHTNTIEGAFSILDRAVMGIFHYVSSKHLQKYCDEISMKYNARAYNNVHRVYSIMQNSNTPRITYRQLTK